MATPVETGNRYPLTPDQLHTKGYSYEVCTWLRVHHWNISCVQTGKGDEDLFLAAPQNPQRFTLGIKLGIPATGDPRSCEVFLQRYADGEQEPLVLTTLFRYENCGLAVSPLISTNRGRERWLQILVPQEGVLGSWKQTIVQITPSGTLLGRTELFDTPFLTSVQD